MPEPAKSTDTNTTSAAQAASSATHHRANATEQGGRATAEAMRESSEAAAKIGARAGETNADMLRRNTGAMAETHRQISQDAAQRMEEATRNIAEAQRETAEDVRTFMQLPSVAEHGLQDLHKSLAGLVEGVVRTNLRATEELAKLTNPAGFIELQHRFMRDYMAAMMEGMATLTRAVQQTAQESLPVIEQHLREKRQDQRSHQEKKGYQSAAE